MSKSLACLIAVSSLAASLPASAVYLSPDGMGQALIYPYYSVQSAGEQSFNTYVTIVNTKNETKVVKVRFREGKNARLVAEFNLYLDRFDMWTAAIGPDGEGAKLVTTDRSCTNPAIPAGGLAFSNASYSGGGDDGAGTSVARAREGYLEVIEMGLLTGNAEANVRHGTDGIPVNCAAAQGSSPTVGFIGAPTGGLTGTGTLINVINGLDVTYSADALAQLSSASMYSNPGQAGTDFDSPQIETVSHVISQGVAYWLVWDRAIDAVTSVFMAAPIENEFVLETATRSRTDWVMTFPTRRFYVTTSGAQAPFSASFGTQFANCEWLNYFASNREGNTPGFPAPPQPATNYRACWSANVFSIRRLGGDTANAATSDVFGSVNTLWRALPDSTGALVVPSAFEGGRISLYFQLTGSLLSTPASTAQDMRTGLISQSRFRVIGMPFTGFMARTFENGTLTCGTALCQGNYSGSFLHKKSRTIEIP